MSDSNSFLQEECVREINCVWLHMHFLINLAVSLIIACAEVATFFIIRALDMFPMLEKRYLFFYVIVPVLAHGVCAIGQTIVFHRPLCERKKAWIFTFCLLFTCTVTFVAHGYYRILGFLFVIPALMSVMYGNARLTSLTAGLGFLLEIAVSLLLHPKDKAAYIVPVDGSVSMLTSFALQACILLLSVALVHFEKRKLDLIAAKEAERATAQELARTDPLTGLLNRAALREAFDALLTSPDRDYCLVMCDVNNFKLCNDQLGHPFGDTVLKQIAALLLENACQCFRYGGDEFCMIFRDASPEQAAAVCRHMNDRFVRSQKDAMRELEVALSFGVAEHKPGLSPSALIRRADNALYRAKNTTEDCVCISEGDEV